MGKGKIENLSRYLKKLVDKKKAVDEKVSVIVGYTAKYALQVHEDLAMTHTNGQARYLIIPARELRPVLKATVRAAMKKGLPLKTALYLAALKIQRASQLLVPVDTGNLRGSAFTLVEDMGHARAA